jgi:hypothetical protein
MIADGCSITHNGMARVDRLVQQMHLQVRRTYAMCNRVSNSLTVLQGSSEETAEGGWRRG